MAASVIADAGFLVALLSSRDGNHQWAATAANRFPPPWSTCDGALSEAFHMVGPGGRSDLAELLARHVLVPAFALSDHLERVLELMAKYGDVPMAFADACIVRMTESLARPLVLTTDADFAIYRRHGRQTVPHLRPHARS